MQKNTHYIIHNIVIILITAIITSYLNYSYARRVDAENRSWDILLHNEERTADINRLASSEIINELYSFKNYYFAPWDEIDDLKFDAYNCMYSEEIENLAKSNGHEDACTYYEITQSARYLFNLKSTNIRINASKEIIEQLDLIEAEFTNIFMEYISQQYYLRLFPDVYNERMEPLFNTLELKMRSATKLY